MKNIFFIVVAVVFSYSLNAQQTSSYLTGRSINCNTKGKHFEHYWSKSVCAGRANEALRANWLEQLELAHKECGFEYVRFHGIFHDDMFVFNYDKDSNVVYNWQYLDDVYDRLLNIGVKPFVEFSFFPGALSPAKTVFWWGAHGTPPSDYDKWQKLVEAFLKHYIQRYGINEVRKWYFEVWNEPNLSGFWKGSKEQYFQIYKATATTVKSVDKQFRVGGPATSSYHPAEGVYDSLYKAKKDIKPIDFENIQCEGPWIQDFVNFCEKEDLPLDFISSHPYPTTYPIGDGGGQFEMTRPVNCLKKDLTWLNNVIKKSKYKNAEIQLTEWSSSPSGRDYTHDYPQAATYIVKANIDCIGMANSLSYWIFTDIAEEGGAGLSTFFGGWGLINYNKIVKPAFHAYRFLNSLGDKEILREDGFLLSKNSKNGMVSGILYNYPAEVIEVVPISAGSNDVAEKTLNTGHPKQINLKLTGLKPNSKFELEIVDKEHGFAFRNWKEMGSPEPPTREQVQKLRIDAMNTLKFSISANNIGELNWKFDLSPWAVALIRQVN